MSKIMFTDKQIKELSKNKNVVKCSSRSIGYSCEFKIRAVKLYYEKGYSPNRIFKEAGFDVLLIGKDKPGDCLIRWRRKYQSKGKAGLLKDDRGKSKGGGRPKTKGLSDKERIEYLEAKVAYLKAENDFLTKLRAGKKE